VLFGLGIPHVGFTTAQALARGFGTVDRLMAATADEIAAVEGIGPIIAASVAAWFADPERRSSVEALRAAGVRLELGEDERPVEGPLSGRVLVLTGPWSRAAERRRRRGSRPWAARWRTPSPAGPTTSWRGRAAARSAPRPRSSACPSSTRRRSSACWPRAAGDRDGRRAVIEDPDAG
jgi:DNA ligase (NAD+)